MLLYESIKTFWLNNCADCVIEMIMWELKTPKHFYYTFVWLFCETYSIAYLRHGAGLSRLYGGNELGIWGPSAPRAP